MKLVPAREVLDIYSRESILWVARLEQFLASGKGGEPDIFHTP